MLLCVSIGHIWQDVRVASDQAPSFIRGTAPVRPYTPGVKWCGHRVTKQRTAGPNGISRQNGRYGPCLCAIPVKTEPLHILRVRDRTVLVR